MKGIALLIILLIPSWVFGATVSLIHTRQNEQDQTVFFVVAHDGVRYEYSADISLTVDPITHVQSQADMYMAQIYRKMYRRAPRNIRSVSQWETWIADGATIALPNGNLKVINKKLYKGKHPISIQLKQDLQNALTINDLKLILEKILETN